MTDLSSLDAAGRRRSPATLPGYHASRPPRNKGMHYPADPPTVEEIVAVMRHAADDRHGYRLHGLIVVLWRAGLRVQEALALAVADEHGSRARLEVVLADSECLVMRSPARQSSTISARMRAPWAASPAWRMTATISSTVGGSSG
jgi:hypothetical protein